MEKKMSGDAVSVQADHGRSREKASRFAILGMLALGTKQSGYDLKKAIASSTSNFWSESYGNLYPALRKMLSEGLIQEAGEKSPPNKRPKQLYSITDKGRRALREWLRLPVAPKLEDSEFLLKLFFGSMSPREESIALVRAHRDHHAALLKKLEAIARSIRAGEASREQKVYMLATLSYGRAVSLALVEWSAATELALRKLGS